MAMLGPSRVIASEHVNDMFQRHVARIVAKPLVAIAASKGLFYRQLEKPIDAAYADAGSTMACNMMDESALEGVQAFIPCTR